MNTVNTLINGFNAKQAAGEYYNAGYMVGADVEHLIELVDYLETVTTTDMDVVEHHIEVAKETVRARLAVKADVAQRMTAVLVPVVTTDETVSMVATVKAKLRTKELSRLTYKEFYVALKSHDWYYSYSDDYGVYDRGHMVHSKLATYAMANDMTRIMYNMMKEASETVGQPWPSLEEIKTAYTLRAK